MKRISIPVALLVALVASACASGEGSPTVTASPTPTATPEVTPLASIDLDGDPELAGRFPDTVGGQPLELQSLSGETFAAIGGDPAFDEFLESIGAEATDVSVAFGGATFDDGVLSVGAFRVIGATEDELAREFIAISEETGDPPELSREPIGGKEVWTAEDPTDASAPRVFIYTKDDTLYFMTGSLEHATEILEALP